MRTLKLAWRATLAWRTAIRGPVAAVAIAGAIVTIAGSVVEPVGEAAERSYRVVMGDLTGELQADEAAAVTASLPAGAPVSITRDVPGVLDLHGELLLVRVVMTDLARELAFRRLEPAQGASGWGELTPGDAVLFSAAAADAPRGTAVRLDVEAGSRSVQLIMILPAGSWEPQLLVHETAAAPGDARVRVRARGQGLAGSGLQPSGWREQALLATAPVRRSVAWLAGALALLGSVTLIPGSLLVARHAEPSLALLLRWGFARRSISAIVLLMGAMSAGIAAGTGGVIGLAAATVMNAGGRAATQLLPLGLAEHLDGVFAVLGGPPPVAPSVGWFSLVLVGATLLGAIAALPAARRAATLRPNLWDL